MATRSGWSQEFAADTLMTWDESSRPIGIAPAPRGTLFILTESAIERLGRSGAPTTFLSLRSRLVPEAAPSAIALHPQYPDSPYVFLAIAPSASARSMLVRVRDSSGTGIRPDTLWRLPGTASMLHAGRAGGIYVAVRGSRRSMVLRFLMSSGPDAQPLVSCAGELLDFFVDEDAGTVYVLEYQRAGGVALEVYHAYDAVPAAVTRFASFAQQPAFNSLLRYEQNAFPQLQGKLLVSGRRTPAVYCAAEAAPSDSGPAITLSAFIPRGPGFPQVAAGEDGRLYVLSGSFYDGHLLVLRPIAPRFTSSPPDTARQGREYSYTPVLAGTPARLSLQSSPPGMALDSAGVSVRWVPDNAAAMARDHIVILRAENGAGIDEQEFFVEVANVNDPPGPFLLLAPADGAVLQPAAGAGVLFTWQSAADPDGDTLGYAVRIDTVGTFSSRALRVFRTGTADTLRVQLPGGVRQFYWSVTASDRKAETVSTPARHAFTLVAAAAEPMKPRETDKEDVVLEQNYPNPFNPATSIKYTLPRAGYVRLAVFNLLGQEVALVFEGSQEEGHHEVEFNKASLPSGIYFYRLQGPGLLETKKMIITK